MIVLFVTLLLITTGSGQSDDDNGEIMLKNLRAICQRRNPEQLVERFCFEKSSSPSFSSSELETMMQAERCILLASRLPGCKGKALEQKKNMIEKEKLVEDFVRQVYIQTSSSADPHPILPGVAISCEILLSLLRRNYGSLVLGSFVAKTSFTNLDDRCTDPRIYWKALSLTVSKEMGQNIFQATRSSLKFKSLHLEEKTTLFGNDIEEKKKNNWKRLVQSNSLTPSWGMPDPMDYLDPSLFPEFRHPIIFETWKDGMEWQHFNKEDVLSCPTRCLFTRTSSPSYLQSHVLVFDCLQTPPPGLYKPPHQLWMFLCMESAQHLPRVKDHHFLAKFDFVATYRQDSHVPVLYSPGNIDLFDYAKNSNITKTGSAVWIASNCAPARLTIIRELSKYIPIDSLGKCLNNKPFPTNIEPVFSSEKIPILAKYKFTISFENSFEEDYVTEKLYHPLIAGSVPIYFGAPNVDEFLPDPNSIVDASRFFDIDPLVKRLRYLLSNETSYNELHAWREKPLPPHFREKMALAFNTGAYYGERDMRQNPCRICQHAERLLSPKNRRKV